MRSYPSAAILHRRRASRCGMQQVARPRLERTGSRRLYFSPEPKKSRDETKTRDAPKRKSHDNDHDVSEVRRSACARASRRWALHSAQTLFTLPGVVMRCTPHSCVSTCFLVMGYTPRSCLSASRVSRGCTPRSCVSACRCGGVHTPALVGPPSVQLSHACANAPMPPRQGETQTHGVQPLP